MKKIPLTQGMVALVDDIDYEWLVQWKWQYKKSRKKGYAARGVVVDGKKKTVLMHRAIMKAPDGVQVDHVDDKKTLDNRRSNLRVCTGTENSWNRPKLVRNQSGFKGVHWCKRDKRWIAQICANGRHQHVGSFGTAEEAARAYDKKAVELHGKFARTNFVVTA